MPTCPKTCGTRLSYEQMHTYLRQAGCPENLIVTMGAVGFAESGGCTDVIGCISANEWSIGVWQINSKVHKNFTIEQLKKPANNAKEAVRLLKTKSGVRHWGAYTNGSYQKYVAASQAAYSAKNVPVGNITPANTNSVSNNFSQFSFTPGMALAGVLVLAVILD